MLHIHETARGPIRLLKHGPIFICASDFIAAGLTVKANVTMLCRRLGLVEGVDYIKPARKAPILKGSFGTRGCTHIVFIKLEALEFWTQPYPADDAAMILQAIRLEHAPPFGDETDQITQAL